MGDFAKIIYERFFLRDLLGKVVPGAIVFFSLYLLFNVSSQSITIPDYLKNIDWVVALALLGLFHVLGLCIQLLGELSGLHSAHPIPVRKFFKQTENCKKARTMFRERLHKIKQATLTEEQKQQRERYVVLKEESGNVCVASLISSVLLLFSQQFLLSLFAFVLFLVSWWTHIVHRSRQAYYEIDILGLNDNDDYKGDNLKKYIGPER